jgi:hypothetical protein
MKRGVILSGVLLVVSACSDNQSPLPGSSVEGALSGRFIDVAAVEGLSYRTDSISGLTDANGSFEYFPGEQVVFSIGSVELPSTEAKATINAMDIFSTPDTLNLAVVNLNRLLITLDNDLQIENGILLSATTRNAANGLQLNFNHRDFANSVINLVANSGAARASLVDTGVAVTAFVNSLEQQSLSVSECASTHSLVGTSAAFVTFFHGVSGTVTVLDDCTLEINNFTYDGLGPSVYFYAGKNRIYEGSEVFYFPLLLTGNRFNDARMRLRIPEGKTLADFDSVSVWCFDVRVNFGDAFFAM